jgi:hypothetical protein
MLLDFTSSAIAEERLGQRGVIDLLSVSFSSNDSVGHTFGPDSPQVRDIAIRTDRAIGQLLDRVDKLVGLQHTIVALTADHGVAPVPESLTERGLPGGRMTNKELFGAIEQALTKQYGEGKWLMATAGSSPYLNYALLAEKHLDATDLPAGLEGAPVVISGPEAILVGGETTGGTILASSQRANTAPLPPFFQLGLVGATVPGLKIEGEIGQQLGYLNAAAVGTVDFILLILIGWAFAHKAQTRAIAERVMRRRRH